MNRKNTILIAVLINAGLLAVLLVTALTTQEEVIAPSSLLGDAPRRLDEGPLFGDAADLALREETRQTNEIALPLLETTPAETALSKPVVPETPVHKLPPMMQSPAETAAAAPIPTTAPVVLPPAPAAPSFAEIAVKKGDNLEKLAKVHHTTVDEILKVNHLSSSFLRIGQVLKIPAQKGAVATSKPKPQPSKTAESGPEYYTVKVGDNPWTIAMKHHMKVDELLKLNSLNEERARKLKPGDRLRIR